MDPTRPSYLAAQLSVPPLARLLPDQRLDLTLGSSSPPLVEGPHALVQNVGPEPDRPGSPYLSQLHLCNPSSLLNMSSHILLICKMGAWSTHPAPGL